MNAAPAVIPNVKLQLLLRGSRGADPARFAERVRSVIVPRILEREPRGLKLGLADRRPPRLGVVPMRREAMGLVSIWPSPGDERLEPWLTLARDAVHRASAYRVEESVPRMYRRDWPDGQDTPGVGLLTLFRRRRGLSRAELVRRWHDGHTPLALAIHPLWAYVRNVVIEGEPPLDAIVEEHFAHPDDLLDPARFFGGALRMVPNMTRIGADIAGFIDLASLQSFLVTEHHVRTPPRHR